MAGIPPTPQEADRFLADKSSNAYEKVVDGLLNSTHFAERMSLEWLDNARYADTSGYQYDTPRTMWPWRDWVIQAFKSNMPYSDFVTKQLAGDLLPNASFEDKIATGFNRNHGFTIEGGVIDEEYRIQYVNDRVNTVGTLFLGLTMDCTRCHNHKYDQLTMRDFYAMSALFDKIDEPGRGPGRGAPGIRPMVQYKYYDQQLVNNLESQLKDLKNTSLPADELAKFNEWKTKITSNVDSLRFKSVKSEGGATVEALEDYSYRFTGENPNQDTYVFESVVSSSKIKSLILEVMPDASMVNNGPGRASNGNAVMSSIEVFTASVNSPEKRKKVSLKEAIADHSQSGFPVDGLVKKKNAGWAIEGHAKHDKRTAVFGLKNEISADKEILLTIKLHFKSPHGKHNFGRVRLNVSDQNTRAAYAFALLKNKADGNKVSEQKLKEEYITNHLKGGELGKQIDALNKQIEAEKKKVVQVMVMEEKPGVRQTHILERGEYDKKGEKVSAGTPSALTSFEEFPQNRLGFAQWLTAKENPLFTRVTVNRFWQMLFGYGLVKTTEDFGAQGEEPSHPELLDWLAVDFRENGWDVRKFFKKMVLSATYRQTSIPRKELEDPENRLLAHGPRFRLQGEIIRDQALYIAGHLSDKIGGPSVYPYQPAGLWMELTNRPGFQVKYKQSDGDDLYRKSLYTFWKRALPNPSMTAFDAPERDVCMVKRARTNTPLQALTLLHDPTYVEAARILAEKMLNSPGKSIDEKIYTTFRKVLIRIPEPQEVAILKKVYLKKLEIFKQNPQLTKAQISVGEFKHKSGLNESELAAFTSVCQTLLNLSETVTRN